jgi:glycerol-3-phosphate dehydrogenase
VLYDVLVIGGGINGCAIAREAALNGLSVLLVERDDLAQHTSSASSKLIHGGLRYLEMYDFALVAEALRERERLLAAAPHLIRPMRFVLPLGGATRPRWMIRAGLFLYDLIGGRSSLPRSRSLRKGDALYCAPLKQPRGFVYSDAFVDDARLTVLNAVDAQEAGAEIRTRTAFHSAERHGNGWRVTLSDGDVEARAIVNAAGPWVMAALAGTGVATPSRVRLVKGSHIAVPRLYEGDHAYILQQPDQRIVFAIPWQRDFTAIGTTDVPVDTPEQAVIDADEVAYLCAAVNRHFTRQVSASDVVASWSGVRPLHDDGEAEARAVSRDYVLELDTRGPPLLSVFGGKITTARHLGEEAVGKLARALGEPAGAVTRQRPFPGGDMTEFGAFLQVVRRRWPFLGERRSERMAHAYGTRLSAMLAGVNDEAALGRDLGGGITEVEARWMHDREFARTADDALSRRSKVGLTLSPEQRTAFEAAWAVTTR